MQGLCYNIPKTEGTTKGDLARRVNTKWHKGSLKEGERRGLKEGERRGVGHPRKNAMLGDDIRDAILKVTHQPGTALGRLHSVPKLPGLFNNSPECSKK
jgi:hypothetical protein